MERDLSLAILRDRMQRTRLKQFYRFRLIILPIFVSLALWISYVDYYPGRFALIAIIGAFELAVAFYYEFRVRGNFSPENAFTVNYLALTGGGISLIYLTGDIASPLLPILVTPAAIVGGAFASKPQRFLLFIPLTLFGLATWMGVEGVIPRFPAIFESHPDWQMNLRTILVLAVILQVWRVTSILMGDSMTLAQQLSAAHGELAVELEARQKSSGIFIGQLAHELRNPLASIKGLSELVRGEPGAPANARHLAVLHEEIVRLESTLDSALTFGRPAAPGKAAYFDLREPLESARAILDAKFEQSHTAFEVDFPEALLLKGDEQSIRQVFFNLLANALEAMPHGGVIRVSGRRERERYVISVIDSGIGVSPSLRARLFEPYVTGKPGGTGLGLSIVRQIVRGHGGEIEALETARGAAFQIIFPVS